MKDDAAIKGVGTYYQVKDAAAAGQHNIPQAW